MSATCMFEEAKVNDIRDLMVEIEQLDPPYTHRHIPGGQILDAKAVLLGYSSLAELISVLENLPKREYYSAHREILKNICALRTPDDEACYFQFCAHGKDSFSFESKWVGWDKDKNDIREPRLVNGLNYMRRHRLYSKEPVYIIKNEVELLLWSHAWLGFALIKEGLARELFFEAFTKSKN